MNVFVLGTGRCGTMTFARACRHLTNYTAAHESRVTRVRGRLDYPRDHIESDPRLAWHFGELIERYPNAFFVHLRRASTDVVESVLRRWGTSRFLRFLRCAVVNRAEASYRTAADRRELCMLYVSMVESNLRQLLRVVPREQQMVIQLETVKTPSQFPEFLRRIGAKGDLDAAIREWDVRYNASKRR